MLYSEFTNRSAFTLQELLAFAHGTGLSDPPADFDSRLPAPPFLMVDRILAIEKKGARGRIVAEQDIRLDAWYFQCHFLGDPVQPGCLGVDAIWQMMVFYCLCRGALGAGRALGCGEVSFSGQIRPHNKVARIEIDVLRYSQLKKTGASLIVADGQIAIDGEVVTTVKQARTGVFKGIAYKDYPQPGTHAFGGIMQRD